MNRKPLVEVIHRHLHGSSRGLTLMEIDIAMALMSIIVVGFVGGLSTAIGHLHFANVRATAESLARTQMEFERAREYVPAPWGPEVEIFDNFRILTSAIAINATGDNPPLQQITVQVFYDGSEAFYHGKSDDPVITLEGYKRKR